MNAAGGGANSSTGGAGYNGPWRKSTIRKGTWMGHTVVLGLRRCQGVPPGADGELDRLPAQDVVPGFIPPSSADQDARQIYPLLNAIGIRVPAWWSLRDRMWTCPSLLPGRGTDAGEQMCCVRLSFSDVCGCSLLTVSSPWLPLLCLHFRFHLPIPQLLSSRTGHAAILAPTRCPSSTDGFLFPPSYSRMGQLHEGSGSGVLGRLCYADVRCMRHDLVESTHATHLVPLQGPQNFVLDSVQAATLEEE